MKVIRTIEKVEVVSKREATKGQKFILWSCNDNYVGVSAYNSVKLNEFTICALCNLTPNTFAEMPVGTKFTFEYEIKL